MFRVSEIYLDPELVASRRLIQERPSIGVISSQGIPTFVKRVAELLNYDCYLLSLADKLSLHLATVVWLEDLSDDSCVRSLLASAVLCKPFFTLDGDMADDWMSDKDIDLVHVVDSDPVKAADCIFHYVIKSAVDPKIWLRQNRMSRVVVESGLVEG
jgi:hypothetical protein